MSQPTLAIITVTYSPGSHLTAFLESIPEATKLPTHVVLADNGSQDGAPEAAVEHYQDNPRMTVAFAPTGGNIGYGSAINYGLRHVYEHDAAGDLHPDYFLFSNPDVVFAPGAIDELLRAAERHPEAATWGPLIREGDGSVYPSARSVPRIANGIGHAVLGPVWKGNPWTKSYLADADMSSERPAGWLSGSCVLVRRSAFEQIGGFDESYFMYMEDVDLGDRLGRAGWANIFVPSAEIRHAQGHSTVSHPETMLPAHHRSAYKFQADRHPQWYQAPLRWIVKLGLTVRCNVAVRRAQVGKSSAGAQAKRPARSQADHHADHNSTADK